MITKKRVFTILAFYYSFIFMAGSIINAYINIYFASIELSYSQIGFLSSMGALISVVAQPILGTFSDNSTNKNSVLKIVLFGAVTTLWFIPLARKNFILILISWLLFNFFHRSRGVINDTITIDLSKKYDFKFSNIRLIGSLGYAVMTAVGGKIISINIMLMFYISFVFSIFSFILSFFIPKVKGYKESKEKKSFIELFKNKNILIIYFYTFILSSSYAYFQSFNAIYSKELGMKLEFIGIGIMLGSLSQFPIMFIFDKALNKFGLINLMTISGIIYGVRWILFGTILTKNTLLILWMAHGFTYMLMYLCLVDYVQTHVPKELQTRGQVMNQLTLFGISSVIGSFVGGNLTKYIGVGKVFVINGILCLVAAIIFNILAKKKIGDSLNKCVAESLSE